MSFGKTLHTYEASLSQTSGLAPGQTGGLAPGQTGGLLTNVGIQRVYETEYAKDTYEENQRLKAELAEKDFIIGYLEEQLTEALDTKQWSMPAFARPHRGMTS